MLSMLDVKAPKGALNWKYALKTNQYVLNVMHAQPYGPGHDGIEKQPMNLLNRVCSLFSLMPLASLHETTERKTT